MRILAYLLLLYGFLLFADAIRDEQRGIAEAASPSRFVRVNVARRDENPRDFQNLMFYQWGRAGITIAAGMVILAMFRRADTHDPFSRKFTGSSSLDELGHSLDAESEKRGRPLR